MKVIERMIQKWSPEAIAKVKELIEKYGDLDARWGFPPQRNYRCVYGSLSQGHTIMERQWESLATMEATYARAMSTPEWAEFMAAVGNAPDGNRAELYEVISG